MGIKSFTLRLEPHQAVYLPGQTLMGSVFADVSSEVSCRAIEIKFKGKAKVLWREKHKDSDRIFSAAENYFNFKSNIWLPQGSNGKLPAGNHVWPFNFVLPQNIPSSFEGPYGSVRYSIKAVADIPFGFDNKHKVYISVNCPFDLNYSSQAMSPLVIKTMDTSCFLCCTRGPVYIDIKCEHSGAVVGENFKISGEINNQGSKEVEKVVVTLKQKMTFHASGRKRRYDSTVNSFEKGSIAAGQSYHFADDSLLVRAVAPMLFQCRIIELSYELEVAAHFACCSKVKGRADFFVGTVPFVLGGGGGGYPMGGGESSVYPVGGSVDGASSPFNYGSPNYPVPSAPAVDLPPPYPGAPSNEDKGGVPPPPPGFVEVGPPSAPESGWRAPPPPSVPSPQYSNQRPPATESCWFSQCNRHRLDKKAPAPMYLSYLGCF